MASFLPGKNPFVDGGVLPDPSDKGKMKRYENGAPPSYSIPTNVPLPVPNNALVVGMTGIPLEDASPELSGWFISDFYLWNYILRGLKSPQTWLAPFLLANGTDRYLHGPPHRPRKVVLSREMFEKGEFTEVTGVLPRDLKKRFLREVSAMSTRAHKESRPLIILVFCHGLPDLVMETNSVAGDGVGFLELKRATSPMVQTTLLTLSCWSGRWLAREFDDSIKGMQTLRFTSLAASSNEETMAGRSWSVYRTPTNGSACGSVFSSAIIKALTSEASPLHTKVGNMSFAKAAKSQSLQPEDPSDSQQRTFREFCQRIVKSSEDVTEAELRKFSFVAQREQWQLPWHVRMGMPLINFQERWQRLTTVPAADTSTPAQAGLASYSGLSRDIQGFLTAPGQGKGWMKHMCALFLQTCPGDWDAGKNPHVRAMLKTIRDAKPGGYSNPGWNPAALIKFRMEAASFADSIVAAMGLPRPRGEMCIMWHWIKWRQESRKEIENMQARNTMVCNELRSAGVVAIPLPDQGPSFERFTDYLTASIVEARANKDETLDMCQGVITAFNRGLERFGNQVLEQARKGNEGPIWYNSVSGKSKTLTEGLMDSEEESPSRAVQRRLESRRSRAGGKGEKEGGNK